MDNFLCTDDMSLHTIGHTSEGPPATLRWDTRSQTPERTLLSRASRPAPQTRSVEERKRRGSCLWVAAASRWTALSTDAIPLILSPARASQDAPHPHRRRRRRVQIAWRSTRGWITYYGRFYKSELVYVLKGINHYLMRWATQKFSDSGGAGHAPGTGWVKSPSSTRACLPIGSSVSAHETG